MKVWIDIVKDNYMFHLAWFDDEDGEGLRFGDDHETESVKKCPSDPDLAEHWHAVRGAKTVNGSLHWDSVTDAKKAKASANAAVKAYRVNKPLPDWALQAKAAGWTAPKGWKP